MMYSNRVCQKLHDEHMATLAFLERLERFVSKGEPAAALDSATRSFLIDLAVAFESEVWHHFDFEEKHLFDYLIAAGDTELARHLTDEHVQITSPSVTLIPPGNIHTTRATGRGPHQLLDVFAPPRTDFIDQGWVLNQAEYNPSAQGE